jgi:hypothetical protein
MDKDKMFGTQHSDTRAKAKQRSLSMIPSDKIIQEKLQEKQQEKAGWDQAKVAKGSKLEPDTDSKALSKKQQRQQKKQEQNNAKTQQSSQDATSLAGQNKDATKGKYTSALQKERSQKSEGI